ncbi:GGDEF domain-containing protein [Paenibacillus sp. MMS20-IR301]|uniref:GGDEF domain-containing protein n=1 Tax=Paenibacillus sp. MMS20-IR301 TaxID=2895946 RepID=UPI0028F0D7BB|nr:GGDEF domain-containing protein [Paenibacillus sp. MMS20-IR301]WNS43575.1 GGDEF domain-containing protein [Paenibacillus sp. MMS20-IR301]
MAKARLFDLFLFVASAAIAFIPEYPVALDHTYILAMLLYTLFSTFYFQLRIVTRSGNSTIDYAISYTSSFGIFAGPLGTFLFEAVYRFIIYFYKKKTGTADPGEFLDTFYNIGSFTLGGSAAYYLYTALTPLAGRIPFGYWLLFLLVVCVTTLLSSTFLVIAVTLTGDIKTRKEALNLLFRSRSLLDFSKVALTNALLLRLLQMEKWEMLVALFLLNYIVSLSFYSKAQSAQHKYERDKFEQMAYRDFLTGTYNRAYMDKMMKELNQSGEYIGIVVADIDRFKKINDTYNHAVGDRVIIHFAGTLTKHLQEGDILFRSGGEEFTLFLRNKSFRQCQAQIQGILDSFHNQSVTAEFEDRPISVPYSASFGLYYYKADPGQKSSMEKGYVCADQLLLESKKLGRNRLSYRNDLRPQ